MRIAVYHNLHSGGAKRTLFEEVYRLAARNHHLVLYSLSSADNEFCDVRPYVQSNRIYNFQSGRLFKSPFGRLNSIVRRKDLARLKIANQTIAKDIDAGHYDVVLVHPCQYTQGPWLLHFLKTPSVYYCHEPHRQLYETQLSRTANQRAGWRRLLDRLDILDWSYRQAIKGIDYQATRRANLVLTNSHFTQQGISQIYNVPASVSYHGVDIDTFIPLEVPAENIVVSVGALTPNKGFDFIIQSLSQIPLELRPRLVIVSNYQEIQEREYLYQLSDKYGVHLTLHTLVPLNELVRLYNAAYLVVYAPINEPFGLVPLEAMACGKPVVAVHEGGVLESVVDGVTGFLVERNPDAFAQAVKTLLENKDLTVRMGWQAREYILEKWTWDTTIQNLEEQLKNVVKPTL